MTKSKSSYLEKRHAAENGNRTEIENIARG